MSAPGKPTFHVRDRSIEVELSDVAQNQPLSLSLLRDAADEACRSEHSNVRSRHNPDACESAEPIKKKLHNRTQCPVLHGHDGYWITMRWQDYGKRL